MPGFVGAVTVNDSEKLPFVVWSAVLTQLLNEFGCVVATAHCVPFQPSFDVSVALTTAVIFAPAVTFALAAPLTVTESTVRAALAAFNKNGAKPAKFTTSAKLAQILATLLKAFFIRNQLL